MMADWWDLHLVSVSGVRVNVTYGIGGPDEGTYSGRAGLITMLSMDDQGLDKYPAGSQLRVFCSDVGVKLAKDHDYIPTQPPAQNGVRPSWRDGGFVAASTLSAYHDAWGVNSPIEYAGMQLAIWEVLYDEVYDLGAGSFVVNSTEQAVLDAANSYLADLAGVTPVEDGIWIMPVEAINGDLVAFQEDQDYRIGGSQGLIDIPPVPDGGVTLLLLGLGFGGLSMVQRRMRRV
jgi:hypothetical protein